MKQFQQHNCKSPVEGYCEWHGCNFRGKVRINSDYEYYCDAHMKQYLAYHFMKSKQGTARYNEITIKDLRKKLEEAEAKHAALVREAEMAEFKYKLMVGK